MGNITTVFVKQFGSNIMHLVQQKGSRLRPTVEVESGVTGEETYMDQIGSQSAKKKTTRNTDTPITAPNLDRRRIVLFDYEVAKLHDKQDQLKMLADPTSKYVQGGAWALGRSMDDEIIAAASGTSYSGKAGGTSNTLGSGQKVAVGTTGLTLAKLLAAKEILDGNETDPDEERTCVVTSEQMTDLLNTTEIKSVDYNSVKALVEGNVSTFLGFNFKRTERLAVDGSDSRLVLCYQRSGIGLAIAQDIISDIGPRRDKSMAKQVYLSLGIGAARLEEEKVVEIACAE